MTTPHAEPLIEVDDAAKTFPISSGIFGRAPGYVHAVDGVSFELFPGESLALVGESGCGKTTMGKLMVKLLEPTSGRIRLRNDVGLLSDIGPMKGRDLKEFRRRAQMIFQDPYESMNPRRNVYDTVAEAMVVQGFGTSSDRVDRVMQMLELVRLTPAEDMLFRYPHELSGGQRQRVAIARALVISPEFVVADEPTSMLDVSISTGIMNLMTDLAQNLGITYLYITHDLAVARYMSNRIGVMYSGKLVELAETEELLANPQHPYTKALLSAVPVPEPGNVRPPPDIKGDVARPVDPEPFCRFRERCPIAAQICHSDPHPPLEDKGGGHMVACYRV